MKAKPSPVSLLRSFKLNLTGIRLAVRTLLRLSNRGLETVSVPTATTQYHNNTSGIGLLLTLSRQTEPCETDAFAAKIEVKAQDWLMVKYYYLRESLGGNPHWFSSTSTALDVVLLRSVSIYGRDLSGGGETQPCMRDALWRGLQVDVGEDLLVGCVVLHVLHILL
jgi:hypothetical protein